MMIKKINPKFFFALLIISIIFFSFLLSAKDTFASGCTDNYPNDGECAATCPSGKSSDSAASLCPTGQTCCHKFAAPPEIPLQVPIFGFTKAKGLADYIIHIYQYALYVIVPLAILVIMYAGVRWILAAGNLSQIKEAQKYISNAVIGLIIALLSYLILSIVGITQISTPQIEYIDAIASGDEFEAAAVFTPPPSSFQGKAIYVHWSAGSLSSNSEDYTFSVTGDGVVHQNYSEYNGSRCTRGRNSIGNMCVAGMGASGFTWTCYKDSDVRGNPGCPTNGQFTDVQIGVMRAKIQELKTKFNIPSFTHSEAAIMDNYHCMVKNPGWDPGKYGCKWDWYGKDYLFK